MLSNPVFWVGFAIGVLTTAWVMLLIITVYVRTRGPFIVGPSEPPNKGTDKGE